MSWQPPTYRRPRSDSFDPLDTPNGNVRSLSPAERAYERMEALALEMEDKLRESHHTTTKTAVKHPARKIELE